MVCTTPTVNLVARNRCLKAAFIRLILLS